MIERQLHRQLNAVAARLRQLRLWRGLALIFMTGAVVGGGLLWLYHFRELYYAQAALGLAISAVSAVAVWWFVTYSQTPDYRRIANQIEQQHPELDCALMTAIEQEPELPDDQFGYLQQQVIQQAVWHGFRHPWARIVPLSRLWQTRLVTIFGLLLLSVTIAALVTTQPLAPRSAPTTQAAAITHANANFEVTVEPGDTQIERDTGLLVLARFSDSLPSEVALVYKTENGDLQRLPMTQNLDDPVFGVRIPSVKEPLTYHVAFAIQKSDDFDVGVFTYPDLNRADALLTYPNYTGLTEKLVQDVRHISAVEGTTLTLSCYLNKSVASAELVDTDGTAIPLDADPTDASRYASRWVPRQSSRLELRLRDEQGRENRYPPKFVINVLPNRPPDLALTQPTKDVQVSPIEELDVQASAWDDFGLQRVGINLSMPGAPQREVILGNSLAAKQRIPFAHTVFFEQWRAEPDQLLAYHFWAEDTGPDGKPRRVSSDMYFAEVRHFEEIFRQGQQPTDEQQRQQQQQQQQQQQSQGGNAQQAQQLAELQKQIINATWKLIRRETAATASDEFTDDATLLVQSQQSALDQLAELAQNIEDPESAEHVQEVHQHMQIAVSHLQTALQDSETASLPAALAAEQAAYQALLKLRAREHDVVQSPQNHQRQGQSQANSQNANSRSQQQLQQLELQNDDNRYEEQRLAQSQQDTPEDRENRQVLNRLRELARRQSDLNQRIKELQSELQAVQDEQDRQQMKRQLKRLREEQQEILRDSDELQNRMQEQQNQERMADQRQQLEEAREQARRSSEALQEGMVSQAAASGSRAERELNELRDEFRRRLSTRFDEQMRDMKQEASEIDQRQENLSERLAELGNPNRTSRSLRDGEDREEIQEGLQDQQDRLGNLLNEVEQVVEQAEQTEPLLAEQLYDTYRHTQQSNLSETLRSTQRALDRGMDQDAQAQERVARQGIQDLRQGIDRAAESVLGDETEALRRAREELDRLSDELDQELARNDPSRRGGEQADNPPSGPPRDPQGGQPAETQGPQEGQPQGGQAAGQQPSSASRNGNPEPRNSNQPNPDDPAADPREAPQNRPGGGRGASPRGPEARSDRQLSDQNGERPAGQQAARGGPRRLNDSPPSASNQPQPTPIGGDGNRPFAPIAGGDFLDWSDRLRDAEEMIDDPELRAEAARIRDRAKGIRKDIKRHSKEPNWDLVQTTVLEPLVELQQQVDQELLRRTVKDSLVPIDRDPVPPKYAEQVRLYYERLGRGR